MTGSISKILKKRINEVAKNEPKSLHVKEICSKEWQSYQSKLPSFECVCYASFLAFLSLRFSFKDFSGFFLTSFLTSLLFAMLSPLLGFILTIVYDLDLKNKTFKYFTCKEFFLVFVIMCLTH